MDDTRDTASGKMSPALSAATTERTSRLSSKRSSASKKPMTRAQIVKWLKNPHLDSAEYRLWGNGICLSVAWFVLAGIVYCDQLQG